MIMSITGKSPTKRTYEMICFYLMGWASLEELESHIEKLKTKVRIGTIRADRSMASGRARCCAKMAIGRAISNVL
jgi:hypothetical protein